MSTASVFWSQKETDFPIGTSAGDWVVSIDGDVHQSVQVPDTTSSVSFELNAGNYTATVTRLDATGAPLGSASTPFVVEGNQTVKINLPDIVSVVVV